MNERNLFISALQIESAAGRAAYLDEACGDDADLRRRVAVLLAAFGQAGSFLEQPAANTGATSEAPQAGPSLSNALAEGPGAVIGPYKLLQQIGEGGMGTVFMAEQTHPVQRKVALKIIKPGMDSRQVIARFEAERQALALMDHPNIAKVLDAGTTDKGRPFFVMELVKGVPITRYGDEHRLTPKQRLELFVPVCQAVQHAHQKGIIHRDLKPSNVMVCLYDGKPVPKVIDFGIAKAAGSRLTEKTLFTELGQVVGTLEYMSPEQAQLNQLDIDTRSDIYSLGVLLYELMTGTTPLERKRFQTVAFLEVLRLIREEESPKPSTRLSTTEGLPSIAANRGLEAKQLSGLMRGELDWILMKTLDKDRNRRYETPNGLALDIQRYLNDEAVQACPPSAWYRSRKFARRNKAALAFAACLLVMLSVLTGSLGWVARDRAMRRSDLEREVNRAVADAEQLQGQSKWPEALSAAQRARGLLAGADIDTELRQRIDDLESDLAMVLRLEEIHGQPVQPDFHTGEELDAGYANVFRDYCIDIEVLEPAEAAQRIRGRSIRQQLATALDDWAGMRRRKPGDQSWKTLVEIARAADPDEWRTRFRDALLRGDRQGLERLAESVPIKQLSPGTLYLLGKALLEIGAMDSGMNLLQNAQQQYPGDLWLNDILAAASLWGFRPWRLDDALRYYTAVLAIRPDNYRCHDMVGLILRQKKSLSAALVAYSRAIALRPDNPNCWMSRGHVYDEMGQQAKAIADFQEAIRLKPDFALGHNDLAWLLATSSDAKLRNPVLAVELAAKAIELAPKAGNFRNTLGVAHYRTGDWTASIQALENSVELRKGGDSFDFFFLAMTHWRLDHKEQARKWYDQAVTWMDENAAHDAELLRFRAEASELLGIDKKKD